MTKEEDLREFFIKILKLPRRKQEVIMAFAEGVQYAMVNDSKEVGTVQATANRG